MRINKQNIVVPGQSSYDFADGSLHSDPAALTNYLAAQSLRTRDARAHCFIKAYAKAQRMQRLAERSQKDQSRHPRS